jgi:hypothetical protein
MTDFVDLHLHTLVASIEAWLQDSGFEPVSVPEPFACLAGSWEQVPLRLETKRYKHPGLLNLTWALLF